MMKFSFQKQDLASLAWALIAVYAVMLLPVEALADPGDVGPAKLSAVLCKVVHWFNGPIGAGIATLAIIVIGIGALMGKVSWGMAIIVGLGIGVIFGASEIVNALGGNGNCGTLGS